MSGGGEGHKQGLDRESRQECVQVAWGEGGGTVEVAAGKGEEIRSLACAPKECVGPGQIREVLGCRGFSHLEVLALLMAAIPVSSLS